MNLMLETRDLPEWDQMIEQIHDTEIFSPTNPTVMLARTAYGKWREVVYLFRALLDQVPDHGNELADPELRSELKTHIIHLYLVGAKLVDCAVKDYVTRMEDAVFIRQVSLKLCTYIFVISGDELAEEAHAMAVGEEVMNFKKIFINWVKSFKKDKEDVWGVFTDAPEGSW